VSRVPVSLTLYHYCSFSCLYNHNTPSSQAAPCLIDGMGLGGHPSPLGSYLNALVIFAQLFHQPHHSPLGA